MKLAQLKTLVKQGESEQLEFKTSTGSLASGMQTVCAFLNSKKGGMVVFGIKDDGKIIGQQVTDKTRKEIAIELNKIEPYENIEIYYLEIADDRKVIVFLVLPKEKAPYSYDGRYFMRNQSITMRMPKEVFTYLYNKNNPTFWESLTTNTCTIEDLDHERIRSIVRIAVAKKRLPEDMLTQNITDILDELGLLVNSKLTNAAVILFCKNSRKQFNQSNVQLARWKGIDNSEFLNQKLYKANAFDLYEKAEDFLISSLPVAARIEPGKSSRIETPAIPYSVLREALVNAFIHRDYSHPGTSTSVSIYDDRIDISNPGPLPPGVDIKQLAHFHRSIQRNPLIAHSFFLWGKIEKWGRGTLNMIRDCKAAGNPTPIFSEVFNGFSVILPLKEPMRTIIHKEHKDIVLTDRQKEIIESLKNGPLKISQIINLLNITTTPRTIQLELAKLAKLGLVQSEGKTKSTIWFLIG